MLTCFVCLYMHCNGRTPNALITFYSLKSPGICCDQPRAEAWVWQCQHSWNLTSQCVLEMLADFKCTLSLCLFLTNAGLCLVHPRPSPFLERVCTQMEAILSAKILRIVLKSPAPEAINFSHLSISVGPYTDLVSPSWKLPDRETTESSDGSPILQIIQALS
jgi:hypothetical protein